MVVLPITVEPAYQRPGIGKIVQTTGYVGAFTLIGNLRDNVVDVEAFRAVCVLLLQRFPFGLVGLGHPPCARGLAPILSGPLLPADSEVRGVIGPPLCCMLALAGVV
ncbi:hypothetical protein D3C72_1443430 [compost metagenome]